jgi:hypothetical protein
MNIQLRPRNPHPETGLVAAKAVVICLSLLYSLYSFIYGQNPIHALLSLGGGIMALILISLFWPKPLPIVVINDRGIWDRRLNIGVIQWTDILDAQIEMDGQFICLRVRNPEAYVSKLPDSQRKKMEFHQSLGFRMLNIEVKDLEINVLRTVEVIRKRIKT